MKHLCILLFFAAAAVLSAADPAPSATASAPKAAPAAIPAELRPASVLTSIYNSVPDPSAYADRERAETLLKRRADLVQKMHEERKRLLEEDPSAKKLRDEIMLLNRRLASVIEDRKSMIELKSQLDDLDYAISRLKPAPQPPAEPAPGESDAADARSGRDAAKAADAKSGKDAAKTTDAKSGKE